jgi:hypothetical protein
MVSVLPNLSTGKVWTKEWIPLKVKIWSKSKIKEGGPPFLKGLARTLHI